MLRYIDDRLNRITMYHLLLWCLRILAAIGFIFALTGVIGISFWGLVVSLLVLALATWSANEVFSRIWKVPTNFESYAITLTILLLIMPPATSVGSTLLLALTGVIAVASKFLVTVHGKHIFNPAAFAVVVMGLLGLMHASWWVGSSALWPFTLIIGLLVVRKIRRFSLVLTFIAVSLAVAAITTYANADNVGEVLRYMVTSSPLLFLGAIMLTEPSTMPARRTEQMIFGALVGFLYAMPWNIGPLTIYPETALLLGNLYAFIVTPRYRLKLRLKEVQKVSDRVYDYVFTPDRRPKFEPGQYMEWTLPMSIKPDARGNRRTFSIASTPNEEDIHIGVKFYEPSSTFKRALRDMKPGEVAYAGQIAGDFTLPSDKSEKLLFLAAGIGVTPFRSMLKALIDSKEQRDIVMIYAVSDSAELAYRDVLEDAVAYGIRFIPLLTAGKPPKHWKGSTGTLDAEFIRGQVPDYKDRKVFVSGPNGLVENIRTELLKDGVHRTRIKSDFFTGY